MWHMSATKCTYKHVDSWLFKGALSGVRQSLTTVSPLKMMENVFYFTSKVLFILKIFKFLS